MRMIPKLQAKGVECESRHHVLRYLDVTNKTLSAIV